MHHNPPIIHKQHVYHQKLRVRSFTCNFGQEHFHEPERIVICAVIERVALRTGAPAKVDVKFKARTY